MKGESKSDIYSAKRKRWTPPRIHETADLKRIVAKGVAGGKTVAIQDGMSDEAMT